MRRRLYWILTLALLTSCGRTAEPPGGTSERLPHVSAPIDTLGVAPMLPDSGWSPAEGNRSLQPPSWKQADAAGWPRPEELSFVRYTNERFGYSIAYPDSVIQPTEPFGDGRGMEFASASGDVRVLVYAADERSLEDLASQYRSAVEEQHVEITYRARDATFYIVAGRRDGVAFYEKAAMSDGVIATFRIEYPIERKAYVDAVTTLMASSFPGW